MRASLLFLAVVALLGLGWLLLRSGAAVKAGHRTDGARISAPATRVVPANAGAVDLVTALVGPSRIAALPAAADSYSRLAEEPAGFEALPRFEGFEIETLLALRTDLVVVHEWQSAETVERLRERGVAVLVCPGARDWDGVLAGVRLVAAALDAERRAEDLFRDLEQRRGRLLARAIGRRPLRALSYSNLGTSGWIAGAGTTAEVLFELAGVANAAADFEGHVEIDLERLLALDPDVLVVPSKADEYEGAPTREFLLDASELEALSVVRERRIVTLPPRLFSTSSIELLAGAERLVDALEALER